ncbi:uncharacterized protein LOC130724857 [Lotus japonicus]|uniref:uncharacterized protein LOC130724857 n=1 Tax=Lotus japonicus TaxID=34305 RepID=UPI002590EC83|nr:uncharacterized protein LOC130724857 [Lotus japonicus]
MPGLSRELVELQLPVKEDKKPVKQLPRRFHPDVLVKIKEEIERLLWCKFIRTARYVDWLANVVPVIKKNGKMRVCIDFRDLNAATPKDEYHMPIAEMMVDSVAGHEYLSLLDGYSGYNQILIAKEDVSKTAFRCPCAFGTYEWVVYIDDIVVKSPSRDDHLLHLRRSFERMRKHGFKMNPLKCAFGVIAGAKNGAKNVIVKGDSELVIKQLTKEYKCVSENLAKYYVKATSLLAKFDHAGVIHIPRINNQEANELAQIASGYMVDKDRLEELIKVKEKLNPSDLDILTIDNMVPNDWRKPIVEYLQNPVGTTDRKVKYRALSYVIIGNELFKKNADGTLLKFISEDDEFVAISIVHDGLCGAHQAGIKMKWLLFRQGMYWPTIMKDCIEYAKGCQDCQKHAGIRHMPASELHSIIKPWPFRGWALDLIGEINPSSSRQHKYIIVAIDYFTKWVEPIPLQNVTQYIVIDFIQNHIVYRFGLPQTLTTDQGGSSQQNPDQSDEKACGSKTQSWHETLGQMLWAYRNSPREAKGATPFRLAYGQEVVLPAEVYLQSCRIQRQEEIPSEDYWNMMFDELVDLDEERLLALDFLTRQKDRIAKAYNKKVRARSFIVGDYVWKVILSLDKKDKSYGKWAPNWEGPFRVKKALSNNAYSIKELGGQCRRITINGKYLKEYKSMLHEIKIQ